MKNLIMFMCCIAAAVTMTGCASFVNGNQTDVIIETNKPAKLVMYDYLGKPYHEAETPVKISLPHRTVTSAASEFWLHFTEKANPENKQKFFIKAQRSYWFWGNLLFIHPLPVIIGFIVDMGSDGRYVFNDRYKFDI